MRYGGYAPSIVGWLVSSKRLFGIRGGEAALHEGIDWDAVLSPPRPSTEVRPTPPPAATASRTLG